MRDAWRAYARHWRLLVPLALVVLLPQALADALIGEIEIDGVHEPGDALKLASVPLTVAINLGGEALYAGIVAAAVLSWRAGSQLTGKLELARTLPYGRLIAVDLILALGTAAGMVLLIVPGVVVYAYLVIAPALIELDRDSVRAAIKRSIELVRGNFWRVLGISLLAIIATDSIATVLESPIHGLEAEVAFNLAIEVALEPFQALVTVLMALALIEIHSARSLSQ